MPEPKDLRKKLKEELDQVYWQDLARHYASGRLYRLDFGLDLLSVAEAMAENQVDSLKKWLDSGGLSLTRDQDFQAWMQRNPKFNVLIVSPFVLVQEAVESHKG